MREVKDIEQVLQWAYAVQKVDEAAAAPVPVGPAPVVSQMRAVGDTGALGVRVDRSPFVVPTVPQDAEIIHQAVTSLPADVIGLVIHHAKTCSRPEWMKDPRLYPVDNGQGRPAVVYENPQARKGVSYCPVISLPDRAHITYSRRVYGLWLLALSALAVSLASCLERFVVSGPDAPEDPWKEPH